MGASLTARPHIEDPGPQLGVFMNRAIVKTGTALAVVAGLMGGIVTAPVAYADAPVVEAQQVSKEQLQQMVDKVAAAQPFVTSESWVTSKVGNALTSAHLILTGQIGGTYEQAFRNLDDAYSTLKPGKNLSLFTDPKSDAILGGNADDANMGTSDLLRAYWLDPSVSKNQPTYRSNPLKQAVNGKAVWREGSFAGTAHVGGKGMNAPVYIQFDLKASESIDTFTLWRKPIDGASYAHTALVVSDDPNFASKSVVYYSADDQADVFKLGVNPTDSYYEETAAGKDLMAGKDPVKGRYVRLYLNGTTKDKGGDSYILEAAITGAEKIDQTQAYDTKDLEASIARVRALLRDHAGDYSAETVKALEETLAKAEDLLARIKAGTATENLGAASDLNDAIAQAENNLVKAYTVTFDDKIEGTEDIAVEAVEGAAVTLPANPVHPKGYAFEGWFLDKDGKDAFDPVKHTSGDITVYAKWSTPATELKPADPIKPEVKPEEKPEVKPEQKPENGDKPAKGDKLPQTGDASMIAVAASALGSAAAFMAARRRK